MPRASRIQLCRRDAYTLPSSFLPPKRFLEADSYAALAVGCDVGELERIVLAVGMEDPCDVAMWDPNDGVGAVLGTYEGPHKGEICAMVVSVDAYGQKAIANRYWNKW